MKLRNGLTIHFQLLSAAVLVGLLATAGNGRGDKTDSEFYTIADVAARLGMHRQTAYKLHKEGKFPLPVVVIGGRLKVPIAVAERYFAQLAAG